MSTPSPLRTFFEQELGTSGDAPHRFGMEAPIPTEQVVSHLVERTVGRAALDAATQRHSLECPSEEAAAPVSRKHCLMVAALAELRPVKLLGRN